MRMNGDVSTVALSEPVIVAQAPPEIVGWGPYQFPWIERLADGSLHVTFHLHADSATAYGLSNGHAISRDEGHSWQRVDAPSSPGGLLLPNGDRLLSDCVKAIPVGQLSLPPRWPPAIPVMRTLSITALTPCLRTWLKPGPFYGWPEAPRTGDRNGRR